MNQIVIDKMQREIMVVRNSYLFANCERKNKFYSNDEVNFDTIINQNYEFMIREIAEKNREYKQPIWYAIILDQENNIFIYERWWKWSNAWESRLHSKISFWVGGHIEREDENAENILRDSMVREVEEELHLRDSDIELISPIWYINDDSESVWEVHIWACYVVKVTNTNFELLDWELKSAEFIKINELEARICSWMYDLESWSQILFEPLKKYLSNKSW